MNEEMKILRVRNPSYNSLKNGKINYVLRAGSSDAKKDYWYAINLDSSILVQLVDEKDNEIKDSNFVAKLKSITKPSEIGYEAIDTACKIVGEKVIKEKFCDIDDPNDKNLDEICKKIGAINLLPEANSVEEAAKIYFGFDGYEKRINEKGVVIIELEKAK